MQAMLGNSFRATAIAAGVALALTGCLGGGGGSSTPAASSAAINVAPSLGRFSEGTPVRILDSNGALIRAGTIGANGMANLDVGSYGGVLIVEVQGGAGAQYFNEATNDWVNFPAGSVLRAVVPPGISETAVTALTHAAAAQLLDGTGKLAAGKSADDVRETNTRLALQFGLSDILAAPALVDGPSKIALGDGEAGKHALVLAALSLAACPPAPTVCDVPAHVVAADLAKDLKDGALDGKEGTTDLEKGITHTAVQTAITAAVSQFVKDEAQGFFNNVMADVLIKDETEDLTKDQKDALATAGSDLAQAKKFFADLRTGILPYANNEQTGLLDKEGKKLNEEVSELALASVSGIDYAAKVLEWVDDLDDGDTPYNCMPSGAAYNCWVNGMMVNLIKSSGTWNWTIGALTGSVTINPGSSMTMAGSVPPMTRWTSANPVQRAVVDLTATTADRGGDVTRVTLSGSMRDVAPDNAGLLEMQFGAGSYVDIHDPANPNAYDPARESAKFTGIFTTRNYRFTGEFDVGALQSKPDGYGGREVVGGTFSFKGTINGTGLNDTNPANNFNLLVGELSGSVNGANYNPTLPSSPTNFQTGSMTFTGSTFLSATDPGLKLVLTVAGTGWEMGTYAVNYNDYNKLVSMTGSGTWDDNSNQTQYVTLTGANGISVRIGDDDTVVMKGNTKLADIAKNRINYVDGTFASLF